jgi:hypothetical protein
LDVICEREREAMPGVSSRRPRGSPRGTEVNLTTLDLTSSMTCLAIDELSSQRSRCVAMMFRGISAQ